MNASPGHLENSPTTSERLGQIQNFIFRTGELTVQQVAVLHIMEAFSSEDTVSKLNDQLVDTTQKNLQLISESVQELLANSNQRISIHDLNTGQMGILRGISFSSESTSYVGRVMLGNNVEQEWNITPTMHLTLHA